jgi:hypothetical protein
MINNPNTSCNWLYWPTHINRLIIPNYEEVGHTKPNASVYSNSNLLTSRSQWPRHLGCGSAAVRLLELRVPIPPGAWMSVSCECCVLSRRGLCDGPISHRGVLPSIVCLNVISKPQQWGGWGPLGLLRHKKKDCYPTNCRLNGRSPIPGRRPSTSLLVNQMTYLWNGILSMGTEIHLLI